jgi:hypothetical protein
MSSLPAHLIPYHRARDGEVAGYLRQVASDDLFEPVTLLGHTLAAPSSRHEAEAVLERRGLAALADVWWARAPEVFPSEPIDLRRPEVDWDWRRFVVVEVNRTTARLQPHFSPDQASSVTVSLPAADILHAKQPDW